MPNSKIYILNKFLKICILCCKSIKISLGLTEQEVLHVFQSFPNFFFLYETRLFPPVALKLLEILHRYSRLFSLTYVWLSAD